MDCISYHSGYFNFTVTHFILISWRKLGEYIAGNYSGFFNDSTRHAEIMKRLNELEEKNQKNFLTLLMALTISSMLPLGTELPKFSLPNTVDGSEFSTTSLKEMPTLIMFICNHCPYVIHYHTLIQQLETDFNNVFNLVAISSNDVSTHPDDAPSKMTVLWKDLGLSIPYLYDESQQIARQFQAECTPEFYVFDSNNLLTYRGRR